MLAQRNCLLQKNPLLNNAPFNPVVTGSLTDLTPNSIRLISITIVPPSHTKIRRYEDYKNIRKPPLVFIGGILANHISFYKSFFIIFQQIYYYFPANDVTH